MSYFLFVMAIFVIIILFVYLVHQADKEEKEPIIPKKDPIMPVRVTSYGKAKNAPSKPALCTSDTKYRKPSVDSDGDNSLSSLYLMQQSMKNQVVDYSDCCSVQKDHSEDDKP